MTRFLLMLPVSLPALRIFPFCNQLRPGFSRANELILSQPVRTALWWGPGAPWGVVYRVSLSRNPQRRKLSEGKAAGPKSLLPEEIWAVVPQSARLSWAHQEMLSLGCPYDMEGVWPSRWLWSLLSSRDMLFKGASSCAGGTGAFQVLRASGHARERMALFLEGVSSALLSEHIHVTKPCWGPIPAS